jgi:type IV pilus assembly protein PilE
MAFRTKRGFTLLEILVVIIIVGVLAAVALPSYFRNIERSRATEAYASLGIIKRALEACASQFNGDYSSCGSYGNLSMTDPSITAGSHFDYLYEPWIGLITATRNTYDNGDGSSYIRLRINLATKEFGICTYGIFSAAHPDNPPGLCIPPEI